MHPVHAFQAYAPSADQTNYTTIAALVLDSNLDTGAMIGILILPIFGFALGALGGAAGKFVADFVEGARRADQLT